MSVCSYPSLGSGAGSAGGGTAGSGSAESGAAGVSDVSATVAASGSTSAGATSAFGLRGARGLAGALGLAAVGVCSGASPGSGCATPGTAASVTFLLTRRDAAAVRADGLTSVVTAVFFATGATTTASVLAAAVLRGEGFAGAAFATAGVFAVFLAAVLRPAVSPFSGDTALVRAFRMAALRTLVLAGALPTILAGLVAAEVFSAADLD